MEHVAESGAGGATIRSAEISGSQAFLRGEIIGDPRLVTGQGIAEYLKDILASKEAILLDLEVRLDEGALETAA